MSSRGSSSDSTDGHAHDVVVLNAQGDRRRLQFFGVFLVIQLALALSDRSWWAIGAFLLGLAFLVCHFLANPPRARADASGITRNVGTLTPKQRHLSYAEISRVRRMPGQDPPKAMFFEVPGQRILTYNWPGEDEFQQVRTWHDTANSPPQTTFAPEH